MGARAGGSRGPSARALRLGLVGFARVERRCWPGSDRGAGGHRRRRGPRPGPCAALSWPCSLDRGAALAGVGVALDHGPCPAPELRLPYPCGDCQQDGDVTKIYGLVGMRGSESHFRRSADRANPYPFFSTPFCVSSIIYVLVVISYLNILSKEKILNRSYSLIGA